MRIFNIIERTLKYIDSHLDEQIGYERLADVFHFSPYYFHRMFSIIAGKTITAYIRDKRLEQACVMLANTKKATLDICLECGFDAYSSFGRVFKNKYGISPKEYRKQGRAPVIISIENLIKTFKKNMEDGKMNENIMKEIEELNKKIELDPKNAGNFYDRGLVYTNLAYDSDDSARDFNRSVEDYTKAIELNPEYAYYFNERGISYRCLGEDIKAIEDFTRAIELDPENSDHYYQRATPYHKLGEYEKSLADFNKAIELGPADPNFHIERAYCYYKMHNGIEALNDCDKAVALDPLRTYLYIERGCAYWLFEEYGKARADFKKAAELEIDRELSRSFIEQSEKDFKEITPDICGGNGNLTIFFAWEIYKNICK